MCQDKMGFTLLDLQKLAYKDEPFIMAKQVRQVFYIEDPCNSRRSVVLLGRPTGISHQNDASTLDIIETPAFSP